MIAGAAAPPDHEAIRLETEATPFTGAEQWFSLAGKTAVRNVGAATLTPVLPQGEATGAAVIVAAGGGYLMQSMENEAWPQARWLADRGVAAFVLKYRLEPTPTADDAFVAALRQRFAAAADSEQARGFETPAYMVEDARAAIALVRSSAAEWRLDPSRIGYLGFSAGAMLGLATAVQPPCESAPNFLATVYPSMAAVAVGVDAPPLFIALAADDPLDGHQGFGLAESWLHAGRPVELHVYEKGGHGFGMGAPGTTTMGLMSAIHDWLQCGGWLERRGIAE